MSFSLATEEVNDIESPFELVVLLKPTGAGDISLIFPIDLAWGCGPADDLYAFSIVWSSWEQDGRIMS